ncbi:MAG: type I-U CRISPR-associated protein Cas7 [Acidobacteria bacterium]|nr:type I-U CRISPR-associated protein Cas7 [Acidobacteriota bacterium]
MSDQTKFDKWFEASGPAAIVLREHLIPVEGPDGVFFPATYAAQPGADKDKEKFQGGYNIDVFDDKSNVCLVDSVGSQANRIEPLFAKEGYADLVPQVVVTFPSKGLRLNLLDANHRAADAIVRCSALEGELRSAFREVLRGNAETLAKLAPTSLVFGVWDSRDTSAKVPRLLASTIRAFNVYQHTRSANFLTQMTIDLAKLDILPGADSTEGFANALASKTHGGVQLMADGWIRRDATLALAALRRLAVLEPEGTLAPDRTRALQRYILGLSLVAFTAPQECYLRQGCNLVPDIEKPKELKVVNLDGSREDFSLLHEAAVDYARKAMKEFGIGPGIEHPFDPLVADRSAKLQEYTGFTVTAVDAAGKVVKAKKGSRQLRCVVTSTTVITKGTESATFDMVVMGAKVDVEIVGETATKVIIRS